MFFDWFRKFWGNSSFYNSTQTWEEYHKAKDAYDRRNKK